jgi:hypothetical protein
MQAFFSPLRRHLSVPQYHTLLILLLGWLASPRRPKLDQIAQLQPGRHRTTLGYLLQHAPWDPQNLLTLLVRRDGGRFQIGPFIASPPSSSGEPSPHQQSCTTGAGLSSRARMTVGTSLSGSYPPQAGRS